MATMFMLSAGDSGIFQVAGKPAFRDIFHITGTAAQNLDSVAVQNIYGALSHVAGQHIVSRPFAASV
ncbi:MAG: hypothetical protein MZU91_08805 [Desulfosudis oleivorans]|nr:hypothetical protein [Desulfosudis oleivorans]